MRAPSITTPKKTQSPIGYSLAHVIHKDATATKDLDLTSFVLKDNHIKMPLPAILTLTLPYNTLNSHTAMTDSPQHQLKQKITNTTH
jgi:hypothetical protein